MAQNDFNQYTSFLKDDAIVVPEDAEAVWLRTKVRTEYYSYEYSFDGEHFTEIPVKLDAKILSDDYVNQRYGGFFTGAFVGLACVDLSGYDAKPNSTISIIGSFPTTGSRCRRAAIRRIPAARRLFGEMNADSMGRMLR